MASVAEVKIQARGVPSALSVNTSAMEGASDHGQRQPNVPPRARLGFFLRLWPAPAICAQKHRFVPNAPGRLQFGTLCLFCQRSVQFFERLPERLQRGHESLALRDLVNCHPVHAFRQRQPQILRRLVQPSDQSHPSAFIAPATDLPPAYPGTIHESGRSKRTARKTSSPYRAIGALLHQNHRIGRRQQFTCLSFLQNDVRKTDGG